jgi:hypothetical protein
MSYSPKEFFFVTNASVVRSANISYVIRIACNICNYLFVSKSTVYFFISLSFIHMFLVSLFSLYTSVLFFYLCLLMLTFCDLPIYLCAMSVFLLSFCLSFISMLLMEKQSFQSLSFRVDFLSCISLLVMKKESFLFILFWVNISPLHLSTLRWSVRQSTDQLTLEWTQSSTT